ncbi:MAG: NADH-quinone oxidoreductase subunit NuoG [Bdellovibrionales bacterium]
MIKLTINGTPVEVEPGANVLQACEQAGVEVPRFCYHDKLSVAGNCRMCLVEIEKMPKPIASCAQPCADGMVVHTDSPMAVKARNGVMELLLANHPLDCPICDQGGECDLQDQAVAYGFDRSRYAEAKRAVQDKDLGPLVKTVMTRCIHCTRCVRFVDEICGTPELGGINRGEKLEIGTFVTQPLTSELSGNLIDICPVGALTSKPAAFKARPWEYRKTESVDVLDAVGSNIRIDARGNEVMRILPRLNEDVNESWINDKTRFACDGLTRQRLDQPYVRRDGKLKPTTWNEAFAAIAEKLRGSTPQKIAALVGDLADCESVYALKALMLAIGAPNLDCRQDGAEYDLSSRASYMMNSGIAGIEDADAILLIGTNPRREAALVNARIRKRWLRGGMRVGLIGPAADLGYPYKHVGTTSQSLLDLMNANTAFGNTLRQAKKPMIILGAGVLARQDGAALHGAARLLAQTFNMAREDWNGFNILQSAASRVGALDLGFVPQTNGVGTRGIVSACEQGQMDMLWLLGADEIDMTRLGKTFVVYQGHHGDAGAHRADVILPGCAYTEKDATYVNTEGRPQRANRAVFAPGEAKEDWTILRAFSQVIGKTLPFDSLDQLRAAMEKSCPVLGNIGSRGPTAPWPIAISNECGAGLYVTQAFAPTIEDFYMTDPISRASVTMAKCSLVASGQAEGAARAEKEVAHG